MSFSKSFPSKSNKSVYPKWEEVSLSKDEEASVEENARHENIILMKQCIHDAKKVLDDEKLKDYQTDLVNLAIALFEKRASHSIYWKENRAKEKFDEREEQEQ